MKESWGVSEEGVIIQGSSSHYSMLIKRGGGVVGWLVEG